MSWPVFIARYAPVVTDKTAADRCQIIFVLRQITDRMDNMLQLRTAYGSGPLEELNVRHCYFITCCSLTLSRPRFSLIAVTSRDL